MRDRWKAGDSLQQIAQLFDRNHSSIQRILTETKGIRPSARRRSRLSLTLVEREEISRVLAVRQSIRQIALQNLGWGKKWGKIRRHYKTTRHKKSSHR